ncbi:hypothetical protein COT97_03420 [Candidatus Falkowbacteria bacterium CG10_big_fil_rev_8_21_14_0_10_39_11]|uniref:Uncharacterized protein n=1 Tax=Candidatus Falkowbacteria bacterium CG10_big_fil_rev_8_21_14_0_10_39_11 TaxID=1974565 RepID=A0A2H0V4K6_9BACT|nr:MAG: hypothetical protein COT97_03420 [Candidatus Falkowbacteria bacterium CG10_big_fil_rev_8_21_14_0_10_39_11]
MKRGGDLQVYFLMRSLFYFYASHQYAAAKHQAGYNGLTDKLLQYLPIMGPGGLANLPFDTFVMLLL